jgi:hypothetical protein
MHLFIIGIRYVVYKIFVAYACVFDMQINPKADLLVRLLNVNIIFQLSAL